MRRLPTLLTAALLTATLPALGACRQEEPPRGNGDATAIRAGLAAVFAGDHPEDRDTDNGECFAAELTGLMSNDELRDAGILDASYDVVSPIPTLSQAAAEAWADAQFACTDFVAESTRAQVAVTKGRIDTEAYAACLRASLTDEQQRGAVVESLTGDWQGPSLGAVGRAQSECAAEATPADAPGPG